MHSFMDHAHREEARGQNKKGLRYPKIARAEPGTPQAAFASFAYRTSSKPGDPQLPKP
jgi:hypothetical protein